MKRSFEFCVTICPNGKDGGDVCVDVEVSKREYELMLECCREDEELFDYEGLEELCERVTEAAREEGESCDPEECEIDYDEAEYIIQMPDEIWDKIQDE